MGKTDNVTVAYMRQNHVFADVFNYLLYDGKQVIQPEDLQALDSREIGLPFSDTTGETVALQRHRDVIKQAIYTRGDRRLLLVLAVEAQTDTHYAMPVRDMLYDALQYTGQVQDLAKKNRADKAFAGGQEHRFLSGLLPGDKLIPTITLVLHLGNEPWDGPCSIHEMLGELDDDILGLIPDYRINLLSPMSASDGDLDKLHTHLREVLKFIKHSNDKTELSQMLETDERFWHLGRSEVDILNQCVNAKLEWKAEKEEINMCKALDDIREDARMEGMTTGSIKAKISFVDNLMAKLKSSLEEACSLAEISVEEYKANKGLASTL